MAQWQRICLLTQGRWVQSLSLGKIPWSRKLQPTPISLTGKLHGQGSLVGYSPWGYTELATTEHTHAHVHTRAHTHI